MNIPVYERMRNPITPPKAKPLNLPKIKVRKWRDIADKIEARLSASVHSMDEDERRWGYGNLFYIREWIAYAESILNDNAQHKPFHSTYRGPWLRTDTDPNHVHPVIKMEDFV